MSTKLIPLNDQIVLERDLADTKSKGGIVIPDSAKEKPKRGTVIAVGPGKLSDSGNGVRLPMSASPGDRVLFSWSGTETEIDGKTYTICSEESVLAVLKE